MSENRSRQDYSRYDGMTTEELEEILRADALQTDEDEAQTDLILHIMEVYARRKENEPHKSADEAYGEFQRYYLPHTDTPKETPAAAQKNTNAFKRILRPLAAVAAVFVLVLCGTMTARSMGYDIWSAVAEWTNSIFYFQEPATVPSDEDSYEIIQRLKPTWVPEGFELVSEEIVEDVNITTYTAMYLRDEANITMVFLGAADGKEDLSEKNMAGVEAYESNGTVFYIFENSDSVKVSWSYNGFICDILGDITVDEIKKVADSISLE